MCAAIVATSMIVMTSSASLDARMLGSVLRRLRRRLARVGVGDREASRTEVPGLGSRFVVQGLSRRDDGMGQSLSGRPPTSERIDRRAADALGDGPEREGGGLDIV